MINDLIKESNGTANIASGRPTLVALTRKAQEKIYKDLVSIQPTRQPIATVYGMRYNYTDSNNVQYNIQMDHRTSGGKYPINDSSLPAPNSAMSRGDVFKVNGFVYEVITPGDYTVPATDVDASYHRKVMTGSLRLVADAIQYEDNQGGTEIIQECNFVMNRWTAAVRSRKLRCPTSLELIYDMERQGLDGNAAVEDLLATAIAEEINTDIVSKLIAISTKEPLLSMVAYESTYYIGRALIEQACVIAAKIQWYSSYPATYVVGSPTVVGAIKSSGQVDEDGYIKGTGLKLILDGKSLVDYMMVGAKYESEDDSLDGASGIFYSPMVDEDDAGSFLVTADYSSLQPMVGMISRYALSAFPNFETIAASARPVGDDWNAMANTSRLVHVTPIAF